jgi:ADP-ribosylation factor-like protein 2
MPGFNLETIPSGPHGVAIWDFSGQEKIRPLSRCCLVPTPYRRQNCVIVHVTEFWDAHAFIWVLDATAPARFPVAKEELHQLNERDDTAALPLLVLANKIDLAGAADVDTISAALDINALTRGVRRAVALKVLYSISWKLNLFD